MIKLLDDIALLDDLANANPYYGSIFTADAEAFIGDLDLMSIWVECDKGKKVHTAVSLNTDSITVITVGDIPGMESIFFVTKMLENGEIKKLNCDEASFSVLKNLLPSYKVTRENLMVLKKAFPLEENKFEIKTEGNIEDAIKITSEVFPERGKNDFELWKLRTVRGILKGQISLFTLYDDGKAVSTATIRGRTKNSGAITSVITLPSYRKRGYASYLTALCANTLLIEGKTPYLIPANEKVEAIYKKLGFETKKHCYYIEIKNEENENE